VSGYLPGPTGGAPDAARAGRVVDGMRARGVLVGRTGRDRATLKIRPPLVFGPEHADLLVEALSTTLEETLDTSPAGDT
jgi:4-aminobutyrate aminotransferase-like enzyme